MVFEGMSSATSVVIKHSAGASCQHAGKWKGHCNAAPRGSACTSCMVYRRRQHDTQLAVSSSIKHMSSNLDGLTLD